LIGLSGIVVAAMGAQPARASARDGEGGQTPRRCVLTPEAGEGPFYLDPKLLRSDITSGKPGAPLQLSLQIVRAGDCATLANARVDVWQADALGLYSGYERQDGVGGISTAPAVGATFLRGTQLADADGWVRFKTVYPSWYGGRTPHLHFKVFLGDAEVVASQIFFPDEITADVFRTWEPYKRYVDRRRAFNHNDPIAGSVLCDVLENGPAGVRARVTVAVASGA
jgi:protocatechuate 3,4-dioxygenase beta subunit